MHSEQLPICLESYPLPTAIYATETQQVLAANAALEEWVGYSREELLQLPFTTLFPHGAVRAKDGRLIQVEAHCREIAHDGQAAQIITFIDITAHVQAEENYRSIFENALEGIFQTTAEGNYLRVNPSLAQIYGYESPQELMQGLTDIKRQLYVDPTRRGAFVQLMQEHDRVSGFEAQIYKKDGSVIWIAEYARAVRDAAGTLRYYEGTVQDITERKQAEEALRLAEANYRSIFEHAIEGIYRTMPNGELIAANPALARMLDYDTTETLLANFEGTEQNYVDRQRRHDFTRLMTEHGTVVGFEYQVYRKNGEKVWLSENSRTVCDADGAVLYYEGTIEDITERKALEAERERLLAEAIERADHDPLTGLLNHRAFHKRLAEEADRAHRDDAPFTVAVMDLDNFKFFNDAYGHAAGDDVLRQVAASLRSCCRSYDILARFGGDEFALIMPGTGMDKATRLIQRLRSSMEGVGYRPPGADNPIPLTLSIGVAVYPEDGAERLDILEIADGRLRRTKTGGSDDEYVERLRTALTTSVEGFSMLDALVTAVDNKDRYTRRHSEEVMRYALQIGQELQLDEATLSTLQVAALLHDVGKIGVPDRVLRKPGRLTEEEFEAIKQHPTMGAVIVGAVPGFEQTLEAIRHHHERWDGGGYPAGLKGKETPLLARIMAVADAYSAMTMDRPYRKGRRSEEALTVLGEGAGTQWDAACVHAFRRVCRARADDSYASERSPQRDTLAAARA